MLACKTARSCSSSENVAFNERSNFSIMRLRMRSRLRSFRGPKATTLQNADGYQICQGRDCITTYVCSGNICIIQIVPLYSDAIVSFGFDCHPVLACILRCEAKQFGGNCNATNAIAERKQKCGVPSLKLAERSIFWPGILKTTGGCSG